MIQDLHSHTKYSFCSVNPTVKNGVITAIDGGVDVFGITDHNYGVAYDSYDEFIHGEKVSDALYQKRLDDYLAVLRKLQREYAPQIKLLCGIEIATTAANERHVLPKSADISHFDYCLIEHLTSPDSVTGGDLVSYAKSLNCYAGVAHTDLFALCSQRGYNALDYFKRMADENIFWELNVNYDRIHGYREHAYVQRFLSNEAEQEIVLKSGVKLSVGFDGHDASEYYARRVIDANERLLALNIPRPFDNI